MSVRYEIEEGTNAVKVFYDDATVPSLYQPNYPGGDAWADAAEAAAWAELYIESIVNEDAPYAPGNRGEEGGKKPTAEEIAAAQAELEASRNPTA